MERLDWSDGLAGQEGPLHLALGVFDGVHEGHRAVIRSGLKLAGEDGGKVFVVTFSPHPIRVIAPAKAPSSLLATVDEKAEIFRAMGVDGMLVIRFDEEFAKTGAEEFVERLVQGNVASISVGEDWRFGSGRQGDVGLLGRMGGEKGFRLQAVAPVMWEGERVSSTRIRQAIRDGSFGEVEKMLGRPYEVSGRVVEGRKLGRKLGFPTANLRLGDLQVPKDGVWVVRVDGRQAGVANLGMRPTVDGDERLLEVHVFDFHGDLYGKILRVEFQQFLRGERKFDSLEALREQISKDVGEARRIVSKAD